MVVMSEPLTRTLPVETPDVGELRSRIRRSGRNTVGVEEEFILVDGCGTPAGEAARVAENADHDARLRVELPDCQIELATPPRTSPETLEADLREGRAAAVRWSQSLAIPISAAVHPFIAETEVASPRAVDLVRRYGWLARSQLLGALQVHVAVGDPDVIVPVHDELRSYLPLIAALAAAAPFRAGRDVGLASVRPFVSSLLPRHGIPPAFATLDAYVEALSWLVGSGVADDPTEWWWDLRIHPTYGTLEVRVADAQPTVADAMGVIEFIVALVMHLGDLAAAGELAPPAPSWRVDENRRAAAIAGLDGAFRDDAGRCRRGFDSLTTVIDVLESTGAGPLDRTRALMASPPHRRLRAWGARSAVNHLAEAFEE